MTARDAIIGLALAFGAGTATALAILCEQPIRSALRRIRLPRTATGDVDQTALSIGVIPVALVVTVLALPLI